MILSCGPPCCPAQLMQSLVVASAKSGGYAVIMRCNHNRSNHVEIVLQIFVSMIDHLQIGKHIWRASSSSAEASH
jgi:hypothetical protein